MSIMDYNGGDIIAMTGKDCVGIAADTRLGAQAQTVATDFQKIYKMTNKVMVGLPGLAADAQSVSQLLNFKLNMYRLREERDIKPKTFCNLLSATLYEKRFGPYFTEPIIAGLEEDNKPFIASMDLIGCKTSTDSFIVSGTSTENLQGMCETLYRPNMEPEELFETLSQSLLSAVDRDALSGWGAVVYIIKPDGISSYSLKSRMD